MQEQTCKFKIDKITYLKHSLEQHDVRKKGFSDKPLVYPELMQNPIRKFRQTTFISEEPGYLAEKLKALTSSDSCRV